MLTSNSAQNHVGLFPKAKSIRSGLLKHNHLKENRYLYKIKLFTREDLWHFLSWKGFKKEANVFYRANVDGQGFIFLMTTPQGLKYIDYLFQFTKRESKNLKKFYLYILRFRKNHCKDFQVDEIPFYYFKEN